MSVFDLIFFLQRTPAHTDTSISVNTDSSELHESMSELSREAKRAIVYKMTAVIRTKNCKEC